MPQEALPFGVKLIPADDSDQGTDYRESRFGTLIPLANEYGGVSAYNPNRPYSRVEVIDGTSGEVLSQRAALSAPANVNPPAQPSAPADSESVQSVPAASPAADPPLQTPARESPSAGCTDPVIAVFAGEPRRPTVPVVFVTADGVHRTYFHHVSIRGNSIMLFYDDRYEGDHRFIPLPTREGKTLQVTFPSLGGRQYRVSVLPLNNTLSRIDIIQLLIVPEDAEL